MDPHIEWFRAASPYISAHQGKTFVLYLGGRAIDEANFSPIVADVALLHSLGIRLVLVHGAAPQIEASLTQLNLSSEFYNGVRITTPDILPAVEFGVALARTALESELSKKQPPITLSGGNHVKAKPVGILDGIDHHNTGKVRKINSQAIRQQLDSGAIVVVSPIGFSPSGEVFNINSLEVAGEVASALLADKLIILSDVFKNDMGQLIEEIQVSDIDTSGLTDHAPLVIARQASLNGVDRCHLLDVQQNGALLSELFTRDGIGTQVTRKSYESVRFAKPDDVAGIIELIEPLETEGVLVKRSRERLEAEIENFTVIDRDGKIVGCAALYGYGDDAELACLVTHPEYRGGNRGDALLNAIKQRAHANSHSRLFVLTTQTAHWFTERGFEQIELNDVPIERQNLYNYQRNSKLLVTMIG